MTQVCQRPFFVQPPANLLQRYPVIKQAAYTLALSYAHNEQVADERLKAIGSELWRVLELDESFEKARPIRRWQSAAHYYRK